MIPIECKIVNIVMNVLKKKFEFLLLNVCQALGISNKTDVFFCVFFLKNFIYFFFMFFSNQNCIAVCVRSSIFFVIVLNRYYWYRFITHCILQLYSPKIYRLAIRLVSAKSVNRMIEDRYALKIGITNYSHFYLKEIGCCPTIWRPILIGKYSNWYYDTGQWFLLSAISWCMEFGKSIVIRWLELLAFHTKIAGICYGADRFVELRSQYWALGVVHRSDVYAIRDNQG